MLAAKCGASVAEIEAVTAAATTSSATAAGLPDPRCFYDALPMAEDFSTEAIQEGAAIVIHVRGEIDIATCERLRDAIEAHLAPRQSIVLDLSEVAFMDSSSLSVMVQARGRLTKDGGSLVLRNPSEMARRVLTMAGAQDLLDIDADAHREGPSV